VLSELRDRVRAVELERAAERERTGDRVLGCRAVLFAGSDDAPGVENCGLKTSRRPESGKT
jgi:hypothetical protein